MHEHTQTQIWFAVCHRTVAVMGTTTAVRFCTEIMRLSLLLCLLAKQYIYSAWRDPSVRGLVT